MSFQSKIPGMRLFYLNQFSLFRREYSILFDVENSYVPHVVFVLILFLIPLAIKNDSIYYDVITVIWDKIKTSVLWISINECLEIDNVGGITRTSVDKSHNIE